MRDACVGIRRAFTLWSGLEAAFGHNKCHAVKFHDEAEAVGIEAELSPMDVASSLLHVI